jgi:hypothetical protein
MGIDGPRDARLRPALSGPRRGILTFTLEGTSLLVRVDIAGNSAACKRVVDGHRVSWTVTLGDGAAPLRFEADAQGDELWGRAQGGGGVPGGGWASLEGIRAGSCVHILQRLPLRSHSQVAKAARHRCHARVERSLSPYSSRSVCGAREAAIDVDRRIEVGDSYPHMSDPRDADAHLSASSFGLGVYLQMNATCRIVPPRAA